MKNTKITCDICHKDVDSKRESRYRMKCKQFGLDRAWHKIDICQDCADRIKLIIRKEKRHRDLLAKEKAVSVLEDQLANCKSHLDFEDTSPEQHKEMQDLVESLTLGITALKNYKVR